MTQHTQGEWKWVRGLNSLQWLKSGNENVSEVRMHVPENEAEEANARLIAAAPKLLRTSDVTQSALWAIIDDVNAHRMSEERLVSELKKLAHGLVVSIEQAAIAAAKGEA